MCVALEQRTDHRSPLTEVFPAHEPDLERLLGSVVTDNQGGYGLESGYVHHHPQHRRLLVQPLADLLGVHQRIAALQCIIQPATD